MLLFGDSDDVDGVDDHDDDADNDAALAAFAFEPLAISVSSLPNADSGV